MMQVFVLNHEAIKERAIAFIRSAPSGTRVTFAEAKRTDDQNAKLHAMLGEIAKEMRKRGTDRESEKWKAIFLHACGQEVEFLPALNGSGFFPWGTSTSRLSIRQMADLIEFIQAWAAENGIVFRDPRKGDR